MSDDTDRIEILGSLGGGDHYAEALIRDLLESGPIALSRGSQFTGRPGTQIYCHNGHVLKLREDLTLAPQSAARWLREHDFAREKEFGVHHPRKTWFLHYRDGGVMAGNIMPELRPLHVAFEESDDTEWCLDRLAQVVELYARTAAEHKWRLDEGLSNYGLDAEEELFYLDDEFYRWDRFVGFSQGLGLYLRSLIQFDAEATSRLGTKIAEIWVRHYRDPNCPHAIARLVRDLPLAGNEQRERADSLIAALEGVTRKARKARKASAKRAMGTGEIAVLADVHANAPALTVVLDALRDMGIVNGIVLGDVVGYGPHPKECIEMLRDANFAVVKGNHDHAAGTGFISPGINRAALWAIEWTRAELSAAELEWLAELPNCLQDEDRFAVHGAPMDPTYFNGYVYRATAAKNLDYLEKQGIRMCFHGHSHMAAVYFRDAEGDEEKFDDHNQELGRHTHSLICPGSVGKTRSGSPGAEFAIYDRSAQSLVFKRLDYAMDDTLRDMEKREFPEILLERLRKGM